MKEKKMISRTLILLICLSAIVLTVFVCHKITLNRSIAAKKLEFSHCLLVGDYDRMRNNLGDIITEEDFEYLQHMDRSGTVHQAITVKPLEDGSIMVIEYYETLDLLGGYGIKSVKVFGPEEKDALMKYLYFEE